MKDVQKLIEAILKTCSKRKANCNTMYVAIQAIKLHLEDDLREEFKIVNRDASKEENATQMEEGK